MATLAVGHVVAAGASLTLGPGPQQLQPQPPVFGRVVLIENSDPTNVTILWADGRLVILALADLGDPAGVDIIEDANTETAAKFLGRTVQMGRFDNGTLLHGGTPAFIGVVTMVYRRVVSLGPTRTLGLVRTPEGLWFETRLAGVASARIIPDR